ncbi:MAG: type II toxin-antitoxin system VapC family toxin [Bryobacteraceae bacterium]|jgi:predicted nucleic acid-binding protein
MIEAAVVDASVAIKWVVEEEGSDRARLLASAKLEAPDLLPIECANILWRKVRLGDLRGEGAAERLALLLRSPVTLIGSRELLDAALRLSLDLGHPVCDCVYLALAIRDGIPLLTADRRLSNAVRKRKKVASHIRLLAEIPLP